MVMRGLPVRLRCVTGLRFPIYANDITLWTKRGAMANQEQTMQQGTEVHEFLQNVGMPSLPERTLFNVVAKPTDHRKCVADEVDLHIHRQKITRENNNKKILGVTLEETARSTKWLPPLDKLWG